MASCYFCGAVIEADRIYRNSECPQCGRDLKICLNCRFYDPDAHWQCRETISEPVRDKEQANFCDAFEPGGKNRSAASTQKDENRKAFDSLFGDDA